MISNTKNTYKFSKNSTQKSQNPKRNRNFI